MAKKKAKKKTGTKKNKVRQFSTGATRDGNEHKLNFVGALCPLVLKRYTEYIGKHRTQSDGNLRDWDNWKMGIKPDVYFESDARHFMDVWLHHEGYGEEAVYEDIEEALCAKMFNTMGYLHELLVEKFKKTNGRKE